MDDLKRLLGPDLGRTDGPPERPGQQRWTTVCVCGHLDVAHAPGIGGTLVVREPEEKISSNRAIRIVEAAVGCTGEMPSRWFERFSDAPGETVDEVMIINRTVNATCPCTKFRAVARVDRPSRFFNQRRPADRSDHHRHPLAVGMRALHTRLLKLKRARLSELGEVWAAEEFDRRFRWIEDARVCSECPETDDVWPCYVDDRDTSEMRCAQHRP
jgi:hypothetical protein